MCGSRSRLSAVTSRYVRSASRFDRHAGKHQQRPHGGVIHLCVTPFTQRPALRGTLHRQPAAPAEQCANHRASQATLFSPAPPILSSKLSDHRHNTRPCKACGAVLRIGVSKGLSKKAAIAALAPCAHMSHSQCERSSILLLAPMPLRCDPPRHRRTPARAAPESSCRSLPHRQLCVASAAIPNDERLCIEYASLSTSPCMDAGCLTP
jgi:hypothetical protein